MSAFIFDDCIFSKDLKVECDRQGLVSTQRLEDDLRGKEDCIVLPAIVNRGSVLVTEDRRMAEENAEFLSNDHPGLLVVASEESTKTLTGRLVRAILNRLKSVLPNWHSVTMRNSIVEVTQRTVFVYHADRGTIHYDRHMPLDDPKMLEDLVTILNRNASKPWSRTLPTGAE